MESNTINNFRQLLLSSKTNRDLVRSLAASGRWKDAEPDINRVRGFVARHLKRTAIRGAESLQGDTLDYQPVSFLVEGAVVRRSVGYVEVTFGTTSSLGSGFLISPQLFITNQHVIPNADAALGALITFDREIDEFGRPRPTTSFALDPNSFALFSAERDLDFALIAIGARQSGLATLAELGYCPLSDATDKHVLGMNTNIIQHPLGMRKVLSIRNNLLVARTDRTLLYETDTETGSSGSPVFNDNWDVIALHHYGERSNERIDDLGHPIPLNVNEGIRASAIYRELQARLTTLPPQWRPFLQNALSLGNASMTSSTDRTFGPPRQAKIRTADIGETETLTLVKEDDMTESLNSQTLDVVIPLRISISLDARGESATAAIPLRSIATPVLSRKSESIQIDIDYTNRDGYNPGFIPGVEIPIPMLTGQAAAALAPLRAGEANADEGELRYQHFSVKLNRSKKVAIFTATNIDGETYLNIDRGTGRVSDAAEGDRWFQDPRISASFYLDQSFYSEWSTYFDRGHLTRRADPTWGAIPEAERANADTFHFTNCSPQHFRFNQSAKYWQGVERYVLETGVLAPDSQRRICVFQGPLFDDAIDRMAGDTQIPSSFFKIVVWKSGDGLRAVGMVVDQGALLDEARHGLAQPQSVNFINVNHWRVAIAAIEQRAELDFGQIVRDADTIGQVGQPVVGREALQGRLITRMEDLLA